MRIQKELDETKIVLHKTIESVLQRGEKIDDLVAKSDGLSAQSKMFYSKCFLIPPSSVIPTLHPRSPTNGQAWDGTPFVVAFG